MANSINRLASIPAFSGNVPSSKAAKPKLLFLDDEERILNALRAIFRFKYEVLTSTSGAEALEILRTQNVAVVISDQRMPQMTGVEFLQQAKVVAPDTLRILLTGFADMRAVIGSLNEGEVFRFLNKPWGNQEIQAVVSDAVDVALATRNSGAPSLTIHSAPSGSASKIFVLVKCRKAELFAELQAENSGALMMLHADTQVAALAVLQSKPISILVTRLDEDDLTQAENSVEFVKLLKRELPELLTIGMAEHADHEKVVDLINQAKVHRYVVLPSRAARIMFFVRSAIDQHQKNLENPALLRRQSVDKSVESKSTLIPDTVMSKIRSIRRFFSAG